MRQMVNIMGYFKDVDFSSSDLTNSATRAFVVELLQYPVHSQGRIIESNLGDLINYYFLVRDKVDPKNKFCPERVKMINTHMVIVRLESLIQEWALDLSDYFIGLWKGWGLDETKLFLPLDTCQPQTEGMLKDRPETLAKTANSEVFTPHLKFLRGKDNQAGDYFKREVYPELLKIVRSISSDKEFGALAHILHENKAGYFKNIPPTMPKWYKVLEDGLGYTIKANIDSIKRCKVEGKINEIRSRYVFLENTL